MIVALLRHAAMGLAVAALAVGAALLLLGLFAGVLVPAEPLDLYGREPGLSADAQLVTFTGGIAGLLLGAALLFGRSQIGGFNGSR